jgi:rubrerythrin
MKREEAIELLEDLYGVIEDNQGRDYDEAFRMAIESLQKDIERHEMVSRVPKGICAVCGNKKVCEDAKRNLDMTMCSIFELDTHYDLSAEVVPLSVVDKISEECERLEDRVAELEEQLADTVSREDYHNLLMASNDIDRALREYQAKEEQLAEAVSCEPLDIFARMYRAERKSARGGDAEAAQGEWIKTVDGNGWHEWYVFKCPFCGATIEDKQSRSWEYNFCPNCRADMRGGIK